MKTLIIFVAMISIFVPPKAYALDAAYVRDGKIVAVPVTMPVVGVRHDTGQPVYNLLGASNDVRNACGYYPVARYDRSWLAASNLVVSATSWALEDGQCVEQVELSPPSILYTINRIKLAEMIKEQGWTELFIAFVNADPVISVRWYSSERLVAGSDEMRPFIEGFAAIVDIDYEQAIALLSQCREVRR